MLGDKQASGSRSCWTPMARRTSWNLPIGNCATVSNCSAPHTRRLAWVRKCHGRSTGGGEIVNHWKSPQVKIKFVLIGGDHHSSRVKMSMGGSTEWRKPWTRPTGTLLSISRVRPVAREEQLGGTDSWIVQNHCISIRIASLKEASQLQRHPCAMAWW